MEFRIADTFTDSLARLTGEEQKAVKTTAFDLQLNPANPGMSFHRIDRAKDKNFWSIRVNRDIRLIIHKSESGLLLCYVNHHDKAYEWARIRRIDVHPKTGAAQLVEIRETIQEVVIPVYIQSEIPLNKPKLFCRYTDTELLELGIPQDWLKDVKEATEDTLLSLADYLPAEAGEALLEIATGGTPKVVKDTSGDPFTHPDAQRRFRTIERSEELEQALNYPWDKWAVFLHPDQIEIVRDRYSGAAKVSGSAGTGKTIVALHRSVFLARKHDDSRVLLTTFNKMLANVLDLKVKKLISSEPKLAERLDVFSIDEIGLRLYKANIGKFNLVSQSKLGEVISKAADQIHDHKFTDSFLIAEYDQIVDAWQLKTWEEYKNVKRLGRKTRLPENQRKSIWQIFEIVTGHLTKNGQITIATLFTQLSNHFKGKKSPYDYVVVDEAQDMGIYHIKFLASLGVGRPDGLFLAGDEGQRIFQQPFSWKELGVDIRGRSKTLNVNYRTSHQIRKKADLLLDSEVADADGNIESRDKTISLFNGPIPDVLSFSDQSEECTYVANWISKLKEENVSLNEIAVFVRSEKELSRAKNAVERANLPYIILDESMKLTNNKITISTMHFAKGLEFKCVAVIACDEDIIPSHERISTITDAADLEDTMNRERHLLYVACTRARDQLIVTSVKPPSEFLADFEMVNLK